MFYVYILESEKDGSYYIGYTGDVASRLAKHNTSRKGYTASKQPWKVVYLEEYAKKGEAIKRELFLKKQKNRSFYGNLIASQK